MNSANWKEIVQSKSAKVRAALNGFSPDTPVNKSVDNISIPIGRSDIPLPDLALVVLRDIMGWRAFGPVEKVRWSVFGSVNGEPIALSYQKFGLRLIMPKDSKIPPKMIGGKLRSAIKEIEAALSPYAQSQIKLGNVTIQNLFYDFDNRYRFFRELADSKYTLAEEQTWQPVEGKPHQRVNYGPQIEAEGYYLSAAMVESYFGLLEHRLILLRAFTGRPLEHDDLLKFLSATWMDKLKIILPDHQRGATARALTNMRSIKEQIRNPLAHGGTENDKGSLFFHIPGVGAMPANFSKIEKSIRFNFTPIDPRKHKECCDVFDDLDQILSSGKLEIPNKILTSGVHPSFDESTLQKYAKLTDADDSDVDSFIESWHHQADMHRNMDY